MPVGNRNRDSLDSLYEDSWEAKSRDSGEDSWVQSKTLGTAPGFAELNRGSPGFRWDSSGFPAPKNLCNP